MVATVLATVLLLSLGACNKAQDTNEESNSSSEHHEIIVKAVDKSKEYFKDYYATSEMDLDGYYEIKNTRVITIKENEIENFADVSHIVEFELYTDYFPSSPYHANYGQYDNVVVYKNGEMEVSHDLIQNYRGRTYETDFSDFIGSIDDYHGEYNCIETLK